MLASHVTVCPGVPPNTFSHCFAYAVFTDFAMPLYWQPKAWHAAATPDSNSAFVWHFPQIWHNIFHRFQSQQRKKGYCFSQRNITPAHSICRNIPVGPFTARRITVTTRTLWRELIHLILSVQPSFTMNKYKVQKGRDTKFEVTLTCSFLSTS